MNSIKKIQLLSLFFLSAWTTYTVPMHKAKTSAISIAPIKADRKADSKAIIAKSASIHPTKIANSAAAVEADGSNSAQETTSKSSYTGYEKGYEEGYEKGYDKGYEKAYEKAYKTGYETNSDYASDSESATTATTSDSSSTEEESSDYDSDSENNAISADDEDYNEGYKIGYEEGYDKGDEEGDEEGYDAGYGEGYETNSDYASDSESATTTITSDSSTGEETSDYDSDSEDEENYKYRGLKPLTFPDFPDQLDEEGNPLPRECIPLSRGIHFSPSLFDKKQISIMRKSDDSQKAIFSSAAFDMSDQSMVNTKDEERVEEAGLEIRSQISELSEENRHKFDERYSNSYDGFHKWFGTAACCKMFQSKKNPLVSTSESYLHSGHYAGGLKYLGKGIKKLDPKYDKDGNPKHPYLGKLFIILVDKEDIDELDPYFVVWAHANGHIKILDNFHKNVLVEREVSFPGFIPGKCVVFSVPVRVPSFAGEYKKWYENKYGLTKRSFDLRKKSILKGNYRKNDTRTSEEAKAAAVPSLLNKIILPHLETILRKHVKKECEKKGISLVYKSLNGEFESALPSLQNASNLRANLTK